MSYMCHMCKFLSASRVFAQALSALVLWQGLSRGPSDLDRRMSVKDPPTLGLQVYPTLHHSNNMGLDLEASYLCGKLFAD